MLVLFLSFLHTLPAVHPAQLPDSPAVQTLLRHLSSLLTSPTKLFLCLLRRPPPAARLRSWDFPPQPSSWPTAWLSPVPRCLLFLIAASMALPGRPSRSRRLKLASRNLEPRGEDACTGKSSPESVSTGDFTKPTLRKPQPFPLALLLTDPGWHLNTKRLTQRWAHWRKGHLQLSDTPTSADALEATLSPAICSVSTILASRRKPSDASEDLFQL